jgi:hypothetical protein
VGLEVVSGGDCKEDGEDDDSLHGCWIKLDRVINSVDFSSLENLLSLAYSDVSFIPNIPNGRRAGLSRKALTIKFDNVQGMCHLR